MSSAPSTHGSQPISSQLSETIQSSQVSQNENESSSMLTAKRDESQDISASFNSGISSTIQDNSSQSQPFQLFSQVTISSNSTDNDTSMMPPPTPGSINNAFTLGQARSSGRAIKPTLKLRGESEEPFGQRTLSGSSSSQGHFSGSQNYGFRGRKSTENSTGNSSNSRAPRLKLNLKSGHDSRGKGDPTLSGVNKTLPYMQGYDRELDSSDEEGEEGLAFEEQIILRMPEGHESTKTLGDWVRRREVGNDGREVEVKFKDSRRALFKMGEKQFSSKLVDLPAIIESHKTLDNKQLFKIADISQMLLVTHQIREEVEITREDGRDKVEGLTDDFIYDHGITPPMKWARKRRFRKRIHKRTIETVEKEVERLLAEDERAENVEYAMIDVAEADLSDSDDEGGHDNGTGVGSPSASQGATPSIAHDGASVMSDMEDEFSQMGEQEDSAMGEDDDVDQDLQRELEEEMLLQQQEDEEDEDGSIMEGRSTTRGRSTSRAMSDDEEEDDDDDDEEDDLFDAGDEDEGAIGATGQGENEADDDDDDDDLDEEEQERRVRETQLEAECKEIETMVKRKNTEVEGTKNEIIKKRNLQTLKRMQIELDMKKSQLIDLKQQRREGKEAAKAEEAAAALAAAAATSTTARTSSSATPSTTMVGGTGGSVPVVSTTTTTTTTTMTVAPGATNNESASVEREKASTVTSKEATAPKSATIAPTKTMDVDEEDEEDEDQGSDESDLFG